MNPSVDQITPSLVGLAATTLIVAEGATSELVVKQFLRNQGYPPYQAEVSKWLLTVAMQEGWAINDTGLFRVYRFPTQRAPAHD
ncbi:hypothetical protein [Spirosoma agri]|uniref:Uncharacterized protein n=1 Tax=Spirosoma agri TaxID=1987381 RepID=A0A6M0IIM0_9BACT|nr:hypothetical protein [Spirosoma agri]NEU66833.1 hypothetical protein [Spirosoma agri]